MSRFLRCCFFLSNIDGVVYQANSFVLCFNLKGIPPLLSIIIDELLKFRSGIRYLDGIGFDVNNSTTTSFHFMLKVNHEQSTTLGNNIVNIARISECILELSRSQTINRVNCSLQSIGQVRKFFRTSRFVSLESPIKYNFDVFGFLTFIELTLGHLSGFDFLSRLSKMLNDDSSIDQGFESSSIPVTKQIQGNDAMRMHRCNVESLDVRIHSRPCPNSSAFANFFNTSVRRYTMIVLIPREECAEVCVYKLVLRFTVVAKYQFSG